MRLTKKLLSLLNRVFDKDPDQFLALRLSYVTGAMRWKVEDAVLTTTVTDGPGANLTVDLRQYRLAELVNYLAAQPGYQIGFGAEPELLDLGARTLLDGQGSISESNGDHLYAYQSPLWAFMESLALELGEAAAQIKQMLRQMSTKTAQGEWLDEIGGHYGVPRLGGEADRKYGERIITEVLRPRANNVAMERAIKDFTGQTAKVTDVVLYGTTFPLHDGAITRNGAYYHNASGKPIYGLFDVDYGYDPLQSGDITEFAQRVRDLIGRLRAAGTHLRNLNLVSDSDLGDTFEQPPSDGADLLGLVLSTVIEDTLAEPADDAQLAVATSMDDQVIDVAQEADEVVYSFNHMHDGFRRRNGAILHRGGLSFTGSMESFGDSLETTIAAIFSSGVKGCWIDPSVMASMFQADGFDMPVSASGQTVGMVEDRSGLGNHLAQSDPAKRPAWVDGALVFDGSNDLLASLAPLVMGGSRQVSVIMGVRKDSDGTDGILMEAGIFSANGHFSLLGSSGSTNGVMRWRARGTTQVSAEANVAAGETVVISGTADLAAPRTSVFLSGALAQSVTTSPGTGTFTNQTLTLGGRSDGTVPFTGRVYGLIVVARTLTTEEMSACLRYMASKTGVTLPS